MRAAEECTTMRELRAAIDALDTELVAALAKRAAYIDRAITLKQAEGLPANIPDRVEEVVSKVKHSALQTGLDPVLVERLWRLLIAWSIEREDKILALKTSELQ